MKKFLQPMIAALLVMCCATLTFGDGPIGNPDEPISGVDPVPEIEGYITFVFHCYDYDNGDPVNCRVHLELLDEYKMIKHTITAHYMCYKHIFRIKKSDFPALDMETWRWSATLLDLDARYYWTMYKMGGPLDNTRLDFLVIRAVE